MKSKQSVVRIGADKHQRTRLVGIGPDGSVKEISPESPIYIQDGSGVLDEILRELRKISLALDSITQLEG